MSKIHSESAQYPSRGNSSRRVFRSPAVLASFVLVAAVVFLSTAAGIDLWNVRIHISIVRDEPKIASAIGRQKFKACPAPLPTLLAYHPPRPDSAGLVEAAASLHAFLSKRTQSDDIDSLSIAVVTPNGPVFERGYGALRANETDPERRGSVTRDSIYRIASISKMFAVLETLILRERGALNWDDPVTKFLPNFTYPSYGWSEYLTTVANSTAEQQAPITLRQLSSHLAGIGRDYPPGDFGDSWPPPQEAYMARAGSTDGLGKLLKAIAELPLVAPQYSFPVYSNAGFDVLGLCNLAANFMATKELMAYGELLQRDIFAPLSMNSSFYQVPAALAANIAVGSSDSEWADFTFDPVEEPAGGQYSSLADLTKLMQSFLSPKATGVISPYVVREWLRPLHGWSDGFQEVGAPWEISKIGRETRLYAKGGNLPSYHSQFVLNPQFSYGVIVLVTGNYEDTATLAREAVARFQPAFENLLQFQALYAYGGALYMHSLIVGDIDVLSVLQRVPPGEAKAVALWSTGRPHEFRLAVGRPELNDNPDNGCESYWISIDPPFRRGAPLDLVYWENSELVYPSAGARLRRDFI
ncbi:beta-lactamase/transpeptidase-like protein [Mycena rebaudengoi]|nr:beta-lactamase/transpeptidase-like protein [Mycena rebaudengoi]